MASQARSRSMAPVSKPALAKPSLGAKPNAGGRPIALGKIKEEVKGAGADEPPYLAMIGGPLLFTAPHSTKLNRGYPPEIYGEKVRIHLREKYTACLAMKLANMYADKRRGPPGSYCVWSSTHKFNNTDADPNYLLKGREAESPFHRMLHAWALKHPGIPLLHIDIHGKMDRKDSYELDLGV